MPQDPRQGSLHFSHVHARFMGQSELTRHSARQFGGDPMYVGRQEHDGVPPMFLHSAYMPHGEGMQGSVGAREQSFKGGSEICSTCYNHNDTTDVKHDCVKRMRVLTSVLMRLELN